MGTDLAGILEDYNLASAAAGTTHRADPALEFESKFLREALAVWQATAKGRAMPRRTDMTPRAMKGFLPKVAIIDVVQDSGRRRFRVRTSGTGLERVYGRMTGDFLDACLDKPLASHWELTLNLPIRTAGPVRIVGRVAFRNKTYLQAETLLAPLRQHATAPEAILAVVDTRPATVLQRDISSEGRDHAMP